MACNNRAKAPWLLASPLDKIPTFLNCTEYDEELRVSSLLLDKNGNVEALHRLLGRDWSEKALELAIPQNRSTDSISWAGQRTKGYTVSEGYKVLQQIQHDAGSGVELDFEKQAQSFEPLENEMAKSSNQRVPR